MAGLLGKIEPFDQTVEEWPQYVERLKHFSKPMESLETRTKTRDALHSSPWLVPHPTPCCEV